MALLTTFALVLATGFACSVEESNRSPAGAGPSPKAHQAPTAKPHPSVQTHLPLDTSNLQELRALEHAPSELRLQAGHLAWLTANRVHVAPAAADGTSTVVWQGADPHALTGAGTRLYWLSAEGVHAYDLKHATPVKVVPRWRSAQAIAARENDLVISTLDGSAVWLQRSMGGRAERLASLRVNEVPRRLAWSLDRAYYQLSRTLVRVEPGKSPQTVLTLDAADDWWILESPERLLSLSKDTGALEARSLSTQGKPSTVATLDADARPARCGTELCWVEATTCSVMRTRGNEAAVRVSSRMPSRISLSWSDDPSFTVGTHRAEGTSVRVFGIPLSRERSAKAVEPAAGRCDRE